MNVRHNVGCRIPNLETNLSSIIYYRDTSNTLKCLLNNPYFIYVDERNIIIKEKVVRILSIKDKVIK